MTQSVVLFGAGSRLIVEYEEACLQAGWTISAVVQNHSSECYSTSKAPVISSSAARVQQYGTSFLAPLFTPKNRRTAVEEAIAMGLTLSPTLLHPTAHLASSTRIGMGGFVNAGVVIGACSHLGNAVVINRSASIGHHNKLEDFVSVGPGAVLAGDVTVGHGAMIGSGAVVAPGVTIGAGARIGAACFVRKDVPDHTVLFAAEGSRQ